METCFICGAKYPKANEGDYHGICPECAIEAADMGIDPDVVNSFGADQPRDSK